MGTEGTEGAMRSSIWTSSGDVVSVASGAAGGGRGAGAGGGRTRSVERFGAPLVGHGITGDALYGGGQAQPSQPSQPPLRSSSSRKTIPCATNLDCAVGSECDAGTCRGSDPWTDGPQPGQGLQGFDLGRRRARTLVGWQ